MTEVKECCTEYLRMFLLDAFRRMPEEARRLFRCLAGEGQQSLERLSVNARVMRSALPHHIPRLEALGLAEYQQVGLSKQYYLTTLGQKLQNYLEVKTVEE
ncbi:MAG: hypothetical protein ACYC2T_13660 [Bacillota bacterium]